MWPAARGGTIAGMRRSSLWMVAVCLLAGACGKVDESGVKGVVTLDQAMSPVATRRINCQGTMTGFINETSWLRAFRLADHDVQGRFQIQKVSFVIADAAAGGGRTDQPATVTVYKYSGPVGDQTIDLAQAEQLNTVEIRVRNTTAPEPREISLLGDIPADVEGLVAEVHVPDGKTAENKIALGTSTLGESRPSYIRAPLCNSPSPVTFDSLGITSNLILSVTGEAF